MSAKSQTRHSASVKDSHKTAQNGDSARHSSRKAHVSSQSASKNQSDILQSRSPARATRSSQQNLESHEKVKAKTHANGESPSRLSREERHERRKSKQSYGQKEPNSQQSPSPDKHSKKDKKSKKDGKSSKHSRHHHHRSSKSTDEQFKANDENGQISGHKRSHKESKKHHKKDKKHKHRSSKSNGQIVVDSQQSVSKSGLENPEQQACEDGTPYKRRRVEESAPMTQQVIAKNLQGSTSPVGEITSSSSSGRKPTPSLTENSPLINDSTKGLRLFANGQNGESRESVLSQGFDQGESQEEICTTAQEPIQVAPQNAGCGIDMSHYTRQMLSEMGQLPAKTKLSLFSKKPLLNISSIKVKSEQSLLIQRDKLSDKLGRRDIKFYDLYKNHKEDKDVRALQDEGFKLEGVLDEPIGEGEEPIYGDIEVDDFNQLFLNNDIIRQQFGQTIKVKLEINQGSGDLKREVEEDLDKAMAVDQNAQATDGGMDQSVYFSQSMHSVKEQPRETYDPKDIDLKILSDQLENFSAKFGKSKEEIAEIYCKVTGRIQMMREYLEGKPVITWSELEDLALAKPDDSPEFQVILSEKGWQEIAKRRAFLEATPQVIKETIKRSTENEMGQE